MKLIRLMTLLLVATWAGAPAYAIEVEATGIAAILSGNLGGARSQALLNAQRSAVEQGVGLILEARTSMKNFQIDMDQVFTSAKGVVTDYLVLEERKTADGASYLVKIRAQVSKAALENTLMDLGLLHKKMGNKRLMVIYRSENEHAISRKHGSTRAALQTIRNAFNDAGFRLFNEGATKEIYRQIEVAARVDRPMDDLIAMALDQQADILVSFENILGRRGAEGGQFAAAFSTIRVSVYDATSGRQIADSQNEGKVLLRPAAGGYDWEKGHSNAARKAAKKGADEVIARIAAYYQQVGDEGNGILFVFRGFDDDEKDLILDYLENTPGFQQLSELKNAPFYLEVELFSNQSASRLRRLVRRDMKKKGLSLQVQSAARNRVVFANPRRAE